MFMIGIDHNQCAIIIDNILNQGSKVCITRIISMAQQGVTRHSWHTVDARLILLASLAVLLFQEVHGASKYKVLMNAKRRDGFSEENTNEQLNWGRKAIGQPEKDNILFEPKPKLELFTDWEKEQDPLRHFQNPVHLPEEDRDSFYHPSSIEDVIEEPRMLKRFHYEVLQGPEEDRDHIYHSAD
ncbi:proline-rich acidic protein 1 [Gracilinanus agilis]|uniref:proline-rich acidic protein 1 n=1 Tax=Gracilinanus agilis TaxID=191870 RepID=UPI001CFC4E43|nr:proline-rich acidic protein 1 [Gracilinanus agilis]